jgi:hypothetical protein
MRRLWFGFMLLGAAVLGAFGSWALRPPTSATAAPKPAVVPKAYGDLVGVTNTTLQTILVFKDAKGTLRRIQWNANGALSKTVHEIRREY